MNVDEAKRLLENKSNKLILHLFLNDLYVKNVQQVYAISFKIAPPSIKCSTVWLVILRLASVTAMNDQNFFHHN